MRAPPDKERRPRREDREGGGVLDDGAGGYVTLIVDQATLNLVVADKLLWLRDRHGYFSRAEIEEALGLPTPHGHWVCPGMFGPDGRWMPHCRDGAA